MAAESGSELFEPYQPLWGVPVKCDGGCGGGMSMKHGNIDMFCGTCRRHRHDREDMSMKP
jgi:hypothetical protein